MASTQNFRTNAAEPSYLELCQKCEALELQRDEIAHKCKGT